MKTPNPPQSLLLARELLSQVISKNDINSEGAAALILRWHLEIQKWQDADDLKTAFEEGRLTFRTMSHTGGAYDYKEKDVTRKRVLGLINNDNYQRVIMDEATKDKNDPTAVWEKGKQLPENKTIKLDAGGAGIKKRLDPKNFLPQGPKVPSSSKFRLGLHDLSASLLNPDGYLLKKYTGTNLIVLMPLPLPEDVRVFYQLRQLSKTQGSSSFKNAVQVLASQFTRPKLASSLDMGTTYVVTTSDRHGGDSIKYVKGKGVLVTSKETPIQCSKNAREDYLSILKGSVTGANEITISYRQYGLHNKYPCFAISLPEDGMYVEVDIQLPATEGGFADYAKTGFLINGKDFATSKV